MIDITHDPAAPHNKPEAANPSRERVNRWLELYTEAVENCPEWVEFVGFNGKPLVHVGYESFLRLFAGKQVEITEGLNAWHYKAETPLAVFTAVRFVSSSPAYAVMPEAPSYASI